MRVYNPKFCPDMIHDPSIKATCCGDLHILLKVALEGAMNTTTLFTTSLFSIIPSYIPTPKIFFIGQPISDCLMVCHDFLIFLSSFFVPPLEEALFTSWYFTCVS